MKNELLRRLSVLENTKVPEVNARMLRSGGMQGRIHRQEIINFSKEISSKKKNIRDKLKELDKPKQEGLFSIQSIEELDNFEEPILGRIRKPGGFF